MTDPRARLALVAVGIALYEFASYELTKHAADSALALAVVLGPLAISVTASVWATGRRWLAGLLAVAALVAVAASTQGRGVPPPWLYLAQHVGIHLALGIGFATSLSGKAMITRFAERVHALSPDMRRYTRNCTVAWVVYFFAMAAVSVLLFATAPLPAWSLFANLLTPLALGLMFVGEHFVRYWLHPEFERVGLLAAMQAFAAPPTAMENPR